MTTAEFVGTGRPYKIFKHLVNGSSTALMIMPPWFKCSRGEIELEENIKRGNFYADTDSFQLIKFATVKIGNSLEGHVCRDKTILPSLSSFSATYNDGTSSGYFSNIDTVRSIRTLSDCKINKLLDPKECAAYFIFNKLLRIKSFVNG